MAALDGPSGDDMTGSTRERLRRRIGSLRASRRLRGADRLGTGATVIGVPIVRNDGTLTIGDRFRLVSRPAVSHLFVGAGGTLAIGDDVTLSHGAAVSAQLEVQIGDGTEIGPFGVIMDSDFHVAGDREADAPMRRVTLGKRVRLGSQVIVLSGATIGDDAHVLSGSVVSGHVPEGAVVQGVPAAIQGSLDVSDPTVLDVAHLIMRVLGLQSRPRRTDGPAEIAAWDSLGALKLLLSLEEALGIRLNETEVMSVRDVQTLEQIVHAARTRRA